MDDDSVGIVVINVNSCDPEDDSTVDTSPKVKLNSG
jgi:hypothetical protein